MPILREWSNDQTRLAEELRMFAAVDAKACTAEELGTVLIEVARAVEDLAFETDWGDWDGEADDGPPAPEQPAATMGADDGEGR